MFDFKHLSVIGNCFQCVPHFSFCTFRRYSTADIYNFNLTYPEKESNLRTLGKYRKFLQRLLRCASQNITSALLEIVEIKSGHRPWHFEVRCFMPRVDADDTAAQAQAVKLALQLDQYVHEHSSELYAHINRNRRPRKLPVFHFVVDTELQKTLPASSEPPVILPDKEKLHMDNADEFDALLETVKPTTVYGVRRDELLEKIRSAMKSSSYGESSDNYLETSRSADNLSDPHFHRSSTYDWARVWKQRHDWHAEARKERRRNRRSAGLCHIHGVDGGFVTIGDDDDNGGVDCSDDK